MQAQLLESTDVVGGSFELLLAATIGATVLLLLGTGWVGKRWKLPVGLSAVAVLVSALYYHQATAMWVASGHIPVIYRYMSWFVTMPVEVLALYFFIGVTSPPSYGLFWRLLIAAIIMVLTRYMGEVGFLYPVLGFLIGVVAWLYVLGEVFFGQLSEINNSRGSETVQGGFFWLRLIVTIGWAVYPLTDFVGKFGGGVVEGKLSLVYNLADLVNQIAFGMIILTVGVIESVTNR